jgi:hypothetical protein
MFCIELSRAHLRFSLEAKPLPRKQHLLRGFHESTETQIPTRVLIFRVRLCTAILFFTKRKRLKSRSSAPLITRGYNIHEDVCSITAQNEKQPDHAKHFTETVLKFFQKTPDT